MKRHIQRQKQIHIHIHKKKDEYTNEHTKIYKNTKK